MLGHIWEQASPAGSLASLFLGSLAVYLGEKEIISFFELDPIYMALIVSGISFYIFSRLFTEQYEHRDL
ncbi:hypothetical protein G3A_15175 [Bacillus sp. 17376]|uniref:Uncharacterized protein n=1 Tax=Mesobacillus boroniphilus JCM 21738 TaxID=1294265 RepID=W4RSI3_9BACI|nr:hypothetical protein [Mesobacillus boroniphilus]ESU31718.1 hypothetical protein G3A_15175 [Bacillus sp. 17376]GAE46604.1 hypothetical protein JCM21738_3519 [Mesobacillus boroniphilus JCM 21738]